MSLVYPKNIKTVEELLQSFMPFAKERLGYETSPNIRLAKDPDNAKDPLGKTAYYEPQHSRITVYVDGRHPKDIMRSVAHEMVHHAQNLRGDLQHVSAAGEQGYAQNDEHLREMEREAYEQGNLCFRDWEDGLKMNNGELHEEMQKSRDDLISMIRDYSQELTGFRDQYGDFDKLATMDDDELERYYKGMFNSPEAQDMERRFRDEEEAELGVDDDFDRMPKQSGFGRGMSERSDDDERDLEEPVKYGSGAELEWDSKAQKFYDRKRDMYIDDKEEEDNLVKENNHEMSLQSKAKGKAMGLLQTAKAMAQAPSHEPASGFAAAVAKGAGEIVDIMVELEGFQASRSSQLDERLEPLKDSLQKVFANYPQLAKNKNFINSLKEGIKNKLMENKKMKLKTTKTKDLGKAIAEAVRSKLQEGLGGIDDEFGFDDEFGAPSEEDEMISQLLKKYNLDGDVGPADADAEAAAERDSMGEFDPEAEDDEPVMMKEGGMTAAKFADMFDLDMEYDNDGQIIFYASSEMGPKLKELIKQAQNAGYSMEQNNDGSITIYTDEQASGEPVMEKKNDEDGDGDVDSDDYMAKKDKAIKKAMGKEDDDKEDVNEQMGGDLVAKVAELMETDPEFQHTLKPFVQKFLDVSHGPNSRGPAEDLEAILPDWVPGQDIHGIIKKAQAESAPMEEAAGASVSPEEFAQEHGLDLQTDNDGQKIIYVDADQAFSLSMRETDAIIKAAGWDVQRTNDGFIIYTGDYAGGGDMFENTGRGHSYLRHARLNETLMKWAIK